MMLTGKHVDDRVSLDVNPASRQLLMELIRDGHLATLVAAGGRVHQAGCNGCIGMGQAPATGKLSLRTVPRNFPGRSGTPEDRVCLVSPETAAASALTGVITDPRTLGIAYPTVSEPTRAWVRAAQLDFVAPIPVADARAVKLHKGPNIKSLPELGPLPDHLQLPVLLEVGADISTDEILPAGLNVLPLRSNIPAISEFTFAAVDPTYPARARATGDHAILTGRNYGQGSSREHAALAPRTLGLRVVLSVSFARIHRQNLINFGVLPLEFVHLGDFGRLSSGVTLEIDNVREQLVKSDVVEVREVTEQGIVRTVRTIRARHRLSSRQVQIVLAGGLIQWMRARLVAT
ncbi:Aconitate hydratase [Enhygromyxa salina]|uniref:Aconitate hydratase n=1 Tax=Enhygromyxa salina TaxID=215803 RepID=A0A0C2DAX2_9BACT|nr:aconitase family protein [Enhygromyxa salina]KIG17012.1 Aconitate hydratase [Enhygromyxa salina]